MAFVISSGRLQSVERPLLPAPMVVTLADGLAVEYAAIWRTQPQIRTVVEFLARNIAHLGLQTFRRVSDTDRERVTDHDVPRLLGRPNPGTTPYRYVHSLVSDVGIYDNALHAKVKTGGRRALVRLDPRRVLPIGDNPFWPDGYRLLGTRGQRDIDADQVIHFRGYNPEDARWGCSPIESLRQILIEEYQAGLYREQMWRNAARVSGYLKRPADAPKWQSGGKERFRLDWRNQYLGNGADAGGTPILEDGMEFVAASLTPEAAQYIDARKLTREETAAAYHIPPTLVGILDHATYSNIAEQHKQAYQDTLGPWLEEIQQEFELQLLPDFPDTEQLYVEFNLGKKLQGSFEEQATQLQTSVGAPYMTRNEARARLNLPAIDGGDDLVTPLNVIIGGQASPTDSAPAPKQIPAAANAAPLRRVKSLTGPVDPIRGGSVKVKTCPVTIKAAGTQDGTEDGVFEAIVATWDLDSVGDRIIKGAFEETLKDWVAKGDPIPVLWSHMSYDPDYHIGEVLEAKETDEGLWVKARIDLDEEEKKARKVYKLLKGRRVTQFSFAYDIEQGAFVQDHEEDEYYFELRKLKLYEVGPCLIGANQETELLTIKNGRPSSAPALSMPDGLVKVAECLASLKSGRVLSAKNEERIMEIARLATEILDTADSSSDDGKATSAPPAPSTPPEPIQVPAVKDDPPARPELADLRDRLDLELLMAGV
jgi:HK97 family phage portal protein/HK97 family phage prohead protease